MTICQGSSRQERGGPSKLRLGGASAHFHHKHPGHASQTLARESATIGLIGQGTSAPVFREGPRTCHKTIFRRSLTRWVKAKVGVCSLPRSERTEDRAQNRAKSLFRNTLPISHLNSKTWRNFPPNPMISRDRGEGGGSKHGLIPFELTVGKVGQTTGFWVF